MKILVRCRRHITVHELQAAGIPTAYCHYAARILAALTPMPKQPDDTLKKALKFLEERNPNGNQ